jgi:rubrerythrin
MVRPLGLDRVRKQAEAIEFETRQFYERALERASDAGVRKLLGDLAAAERQHVSLAQSLGNQLLPSQTRREEDAARRRVFVLQVVQPGLAGLMDGSVSTLAPLFAAAFATHDTWQTFLVGMAASVGAGISMGFAEALSDDGVLTGRGHPWLRGAITGFMTTLGGIGHTLPYLVRDFWTATTIAIAVVLVELFAIAYIRARYMDTPFLRACFEVVVGGLIVFGAGILIGNA